MLERLYALCYDVASRFNDSDSRFLIAMVLDEAERQQGAKCRNQVHA